MEEAPIILSVKLAFCQDCSSSLNIINEVELHKEDFRILNLGFTQEATFTSQYIFILNFYITEGN